MTIGDCACAAPAAHSPDETAQTHVRLGVLVCAFHLNQSSSREWPWSDVLPPGVHSAQPHPFPAGDPLASRGLLS